MSEVKARMMAGALKMYCNSWGRRFNFEEMVLALVGKNTVDEIESSAKPLIHSI